MNGIHDGKEPLSMRVSSVFCAQDEFQNVVGKIDIYIKMLNLWITLWITFTKALNMLNS